MSLLPHPPAVRGLLQALALGSTLTLATGALENDRVAWFPPIVFVSRQPVPGGPGAVPGLGPDQRAAAAGGRLLLRDEGGRVKDLLPPGAFFDVADPAVSFDGRWVAFAGLERPGAGWRIHRIAVDGGGLRALTSGPREVDDLDPCWVDERVLVFASTRAGGRAEYADLPVTNLFLLDTGARGAEPVRITAERNGAEEPALDPRTGRLVYARWWFNRRRPSRDAEGWTLDPVRAAFPDTINLWQAIEVGADGRDPRLAAGEVGSRRGTMAYQPVPIPGGGLVAVSAVNLGLSPAPIATAIQRLPRGFGPAVRIAGAILSERGGDPYSAALGLAAPSACAPATLPSGGLVFSYAPGGRGDFGLWFVGANGGTPRRLLDLPGTLELDAAPVAVRPVPPAARAAAARALAHPPMAGPLLDQAGVRASHGTFRFLCLNVFANAPVDHPAADAPFLARGARVRFLATLPGAYGDTIVRVREAPIAADGSIDVAGLPAGLPLFEQVVDGRGSVLLSAHGAAHVAGFNAGVPGGTTRCIGCHAGHSTLLARGAPAEPEWFNAATSARVEVSSLAPGARADALVDRRTRGAPAEVAWVTAAGGPQSARLAWREPIELRELVLHRVRRDGETDLRVGRCDVRLIRAGHEVGRLEARGPGGGGARLRLRPQWVDAIEIRLVDSRGLVAGRPATGLAEVEAIARLGTPPNPP